MGDPVIAIPGEGVFFENGVEDQGDVCLGMMDTS